ncbi:MAG: hypothetical protein SWJ54_13775 [Cyanobacteriota bacterium]|nr:hypothetical protein [Cyanobacteriota bacterium]
MIISDLNYIETANTQEIEGGKKKFRWSGKAKASSYTSAIAIKGETYSDTDNTAKSTPFFKFADSDSGSGAYGLLAATSAGGHAVAY